jgi:hypothetical protein
MRWLGANLEEKQEPRRPSVAEAQNGDSMKSSGRNLTLAAIEKRSFADAGLIVPIDNLWVGRVDHGMIRPEGRSR